MSIKIPFTNYILPFKIYYYYLIYTIKHILVLFLFYCLINIFDLIKFQVFLLLLTYDCKILNLIFIKSSLIHLNIINN